MALAAVVGALFSPQEVGAQTHPDGRRAPPQAQDGCDEILDIEVKMTRAQNADDLTVSWARDINYVDIGPHTINARSAAAHLIAQQFAAIENVRTNILHIKCATSGTLGYAYSTQHFIANIRGSAAVISLIFRETDIFEKRHGKWLLVHQQLSVPADLSTGMAVISSDVAVVTGSGP